MTEECLLREVEQVREREIAALQQQQRQLGEIQNLREQVWVFCNRVAETLRGFNFDQKRLALEALQVRVVLSREGAKLFGAIPTNLATIVQTSA